MNEPDDTDMLAAEYVLGTLDAAEREHVTARLVDDAGLSRAVRDWEERLAPLVDAVPPVAPPLRAYGEIETRLFGAPDGRQGALSGAAAAALRRRVRRWRGAAAGFAVLAASLAVWVGVRDGAPAVGAQRFAAVLQRDAGSPAMLVEVDLAKRSLAVRPFAAAAPAGRSYELWVIDPALGRPRSLGVVPANGDTRRSPAFPDPALVGDATYAVTLEQPGGSPTGQPTTAPVLTGKLSPFPP